MWKGDLEGGENSPTASLRQEPSPEVHLAHHHGRLVIGDQDGGEVGPILSGQGGLLIFLQNAKTFLQSQSWFYFLLSSF